MQDDLSNWTPLPKPEFLSSGGRYVAVEPIRDDRRFGELYEAFSTDAGGDLWEWMGYGPFNSREEFLAFAGKNYHSPDVLFHAIVPVERGRAEGVAALMRIDSRNGVAEIGQICLAPALQRTRAATEAVHLLMRHVFERCGYRRLEWKCDARNLKSRRAAERLGFAYEGTFRQHMVVKGRNRDTAWYAVIDREWPEIERACVAWLAPANFDSTGAQLRTLEDIRRART